LRRKILFSAVTSLLFWLWFCLGLVVDAGDSNVLFSVEDNVLTVGEFKRQLAQFSRQGRMPQRTPDKKKEFLNFLIDTKLLAIEAKKEGLDQDPEVRKKINAAVENILAAEMVKRKTPNNQEVTDEAARTYYHGNLDKFTQKEQVLVRQIILKTQEEAETVLAEIKKGERFEKLAKEKSTDLSARSSGLVGWLRKGRLPEVVETAAYALKKGESSGIIASREGFHIIRVEDRMKSRAIPYDKVKGIVLARARTEKQMNALGDFMAKLRERHKVEINNEIIEDEIGK